MNTSNDSHQLYLENFHTGKVEWIGVIDIELLNYQIAKMEQVVDTINDNELEGVLSLLEAIKDKADPIE